MPLRRRLQFPFLFLFFFSATAAAAAASGGDGGGGGEGRMWVTKRRRKKTVRGGEGVDAVWEKGCWLVLPSLPTQEGAIGKALPEFKIFFLSLPPSFPPKKEPRAERKQGVMKKAKKGSLLVIEFGGI